MSKDEQSQNCLLRKAEHSHSSANCKRLLCSVAAAATAPPRPSPRENTCPRRSSPQLASSEMARHSCTWALPAAAQGAAAGPGASEAGHSRFPEPSHEPGHLCCRDHRRALLLLRKGGGVVWCGECSVGGWVVWCVCGCSRPTTRCAVLAWGDPAAPPVLPLLSLHNAACHSVAHAGKLVQGRGHPPPSMRTRAAPVKLIPGRSIGRPPPPPPHLSTLHR